MSAGRPSTRDDDAIDHLLGTALPPQPPDPVPDLRSRRALDPCALLGGRLRARKGLDEVRHDPLGEEAAALRVAVTVGAAARLRVVPQWLRHVELVLRARACDVEQPPFLLDTVFAPGGHVAGDVAVGGVDHVDDVELESLGRVHRREHQVVLVEYRRASEV